MREGRRADRLAPWYDLRVQPVGVRAVVAGIVLLVAGVAHARPPKAPDVVPGIAANYRIVKVFTPAPLVVWLAHLWGRHMVLAAPAAPKSPFAILDAGPSPMLEATAPSDLKVTVAELPRTADLFLVDLQSAAPDPAVARRTYYLVHRTESSARLVCRFAGPNSGPLSFHAVSSSPFTFQITSAAAEREQVRYVVENQGLCRPIFPAGGPTTDLAYDLAFEHATMLHGLERWMEVPGAFDIVIHARPDGAHAERSAGSAMRAWSNVLDLQCFPRKGDLRPQPIEGWLAKQLHSFDDYIELFPGSDTAVDAMYRKARQLWGCNHLEAAAELFKTIAETAPTHSLARDASQLHGYVREYIARRDAPRKKRAAPTTGHARN